MKVGVEIHAPLTIEAPPVAALKELFTRLDTPWLGFIPDMSSSMRAIPDAVDDAHRAAGIAPELTALTKALWAEDGPTMAKFPELERRAAEAGATPPQVGNLKMLFTMHGKMAPERWADFFPHVVHVHGKFYGIVDGQDPSIDWPAVARVLVEQGYTASSPASTRRTPTATATTPSTRSAPSTTCSSACSRSQPAVAR